jgi:ACS family glucarate transporter-like MFS transporter
LPTSPLAAALSVPRPTRVRWGVMALLCFLSFLTYFDRVCMMRAKGDIAATLHLSTQQMGWVLGAFWLAYALFEIPSGWLCDRFGPRITLTRIVLAWSLFTALSGCATGFCSLLLWRFLFGVGEAGAYPSMARVQAQWLPPESRARAGGLLWLTARWGGAASPLLFGMLLTLFGSSGFRMHVPILADLAPWRVAFFAAALVGVGWCVVFYLWFRDDPAAKPSVNAAELALIRHGGPPAPPRHTMPPEAWRALFSSPSLWALGLLYLFNSFGWSFFVSWVPDYLKAVHRTEFNQSEIMAGLPLFCGGLSCLVGGWLCDFAVRTTGRKRLCRAIFPVLGYTAAAVAMFCVPMTRTPRQAVVLLCLASAAHDFGQGSNWASIVDIGGIYAGVAAGLINLVGNQANFLQPPIGAWVFQHHGWPALFSTYASTYLVAAMMWLVIDPTRRFYERTQSS